MKYWNRQRILRIRKREEKRWKRAHDHYLEAKEKERTYTPGDTRKNTRLMLDALGNPLHRKMLTRLRERGAMSVTHLARPFRIMLPDAMRHVHILERSGLITTKKQGRIRFCVYNTNAVRELS